MIQEDMVTLRSKIPWRIFVPAARRTLASPDCLSLPLSLFLSLPLSLFPCSPFPSSAYALPFSLP